MDQGTGKIFQRGYERGMSSGREQQLIIGWSGVVSAAWHAGK